MVHRIQNRNLGYSDNSSKNLVLNQPAINITEGATALDMNTTIEQNKIAEEQEQTQTEETSFGNISIENATYLQNMENGHNNIDTKTKSDEELPHFEVDSIELANPQLFSDDKKTDLGEAENIDEKGPDVYESQDVKEGFGTTEPEMFESSESEKDFEIPAFLRRQKN